MMKSMCFGKSKNIAANGENTFPSLFSNAFFSELLNHDYVIKG